MQEDIAFKKIEKIVKEILDDQILDIKFEQKNIIIRSKQVERKTITEWGANIFIRLRKEVPNFNSDLIMNGSRFHFPS